MRVCDSRLQAGKVPIGGFHLRKHFAPATTAERPEALCSLRRRRLDTTFCDTPYPLRRPAKPLRQPLAQPPCTLCAGPVESQALGAGEPLSSAKLRSLRLPPSSKTSLGTEPSQYIRSLPSP